MSAAVAGEDQKLSAASHSGDGNGDKCLDFVPETTVPPRLGTLGRICYMNSIVYLTGATLNPPKIKVVHSHLENMPEPQEEQV